MLVNVHNFKLLIRFGAVDDDGDQLDHKKNVA